MPYRIQRSRRGKQSVFYVVNERGKRVHGKPHRRKGEAQAHLRALYANVPEAKMSISPTPVARFAEQSFKPPKMVQRAAQQALKVRASKPPSQRGMTAVGLARARDLANGRPVSLKTVKRMKRYFDRHEVDQQGSTWGDRGKGWQAWQGWGGSPGRRFAQKIVRRSERD
jgi:hypothetical protein